jgi:hypothetical protein
LRERQAEKKYLETGNRRERENISRRKRKIVKELKKIKRMK